MNSLVLYVKRTIIIMLGMNIHVVALYARKGSS